VGGKRIPLANSKEKASKLNLTEALIPCDFKAKG
jgi:hypothetical protein